MWRTSDVPSATMSDVLRCHDWAYVRGVASACAKLVDSPGSVGHLDADTAISHLSYLAALKAAGAVCEGVDQVMAGKVGEGVDQVMAGKVGEGVDQVMAGKVGG